MGFLDIFKKKQIATITRPQQPTVEQVITQIYQQTGKQIAMGLIDLPQVQENQLTNYTEQRSE